MSAETLEPGATRVFYDGECGLCHGALRWLVRRDRAISRLRFAPLQGQTAAEVIGAGRLKGLPDSLLVLDPGGEILDRSRAALRLLSMAGGFWAVLASVLRFIPRAVADAVYDLVARNRHRLFSRPEGLCPRVSPRLLERFDP